MLIEKVDFKAISKFRGKNIVPVMVCIGDDYYEITPRISKSDNSWGIFQKLFYNKIYSIEKGKNFIDGLLEVPVFSSNIIVFSKTERTFHNNTANKGDTAAKFAEDRYAIIMSKSYNNLVMAKKVINGTKISNIDLYVADKNDFSEKEYQYEISILKKQCINEQESKRIRKAGIIVTEYKYNNHGDIVESTTRDVSDYKDPLTGNHVNGGNEITSYLSYEYEYDDKGLVLTEKKYNNRKELINYKEYTYERVKE